MRSSVAVVAFATSLWLPSYAVRAQPYEVVIVDDLADVAGCRFLGPVRAATTGPWTPEMLQRRAYRADRMAVPGLLPPVRPMAVAAEEPLALA